MSWESIVNAVNNFFAQPVPIICCSVGSLLILIVTIISKTSIGKKALNKLSKQYAEIVGTYEKAKQDHEKAIAELKEEYETKLALVQYKRDELEQLVIYICEHTNNKKVKEALEHYNEISNKVIGISEVVEKREQELKVQYENELAQWKEQAELKLAELDALIKARQEELEYVEEIADTIKETL